MNATAVEMIDPVLTTEAARILEVSPETIRQWERLGRLPALKTSRGVRLFSRRDVLALKARRDQEHDGTDGKQRMNGI
jgi:excisionase family DNA binding protein